MEGVAKVRKRRFQNSEVNVELYIANFTEVLFRVPVLKPGGVEGGKRKRDVADEGEAPVSAKQKLAGFAFAGN